MSDNGWRAKCLKPAVTDSRGRHERRTDAENQRAQPVEAVGVACSHTTRVQAPSWKVVRGNGEATLLPQQPVCDDTGRARSAGMSTCGIRATNTPTNLEQTLPSHDGTKITAGPADFDDVDASVVRELDDTGDWAGFSVTHQLDTGGVVLTGRLSVSAVSWLADRVAVGVVVFPATRIRELVLRAGAEVGYTLIRALVLTGPLILHENGEVGVQVVVGAANKQCIRPVWVYAVGGQCSSGWTLYADGVLAMSNGGQDVLRAHRSGRA